MVLCIRCTDPVWWVGLPTRSVAGADGLAIDLGGVHQREQPTVQLDTLGLTMGLQYPLDLCNAERHTVESNMSFTTTLQLLPVAQ